MTKFFPVCGIGPICHKTQGFARCNYATFDYRNRGNCLLKHGAFAAFGLGDAGAKPRIGRKSG